MLARPGTLVAASRAVRIGVFNAGKATIQAHLRRAAALRGDLLGRALEATYVDDEDGSVATLLQVLAQGSHTVAELPAVMRERGFEVTEAEMASAADVLLLGAGGMGSGVLQSLIGLGVGRVRLVDFDVVEEKNLSRQFTYGRDDIGDAFLADEAASVPDASVIQMAHLRKVAQVRLADLAGFSHLRLIRVVDVRQKAEYVDLSIPSGLPVEQVHIVAARFDPHRLAATPTIAYVTLGGNTEPVSVAALARLPNLVRLDLSEAAVADVASVAAFPALRVLILSAQQWDELLRTGWTPNLLAAVELGGHTSVAESAAWLTAIRGVGHPAVRYRTIRGRL
jgi:hypothetical protein